MPRISVSFPSRMFFFAFILAGFMLSGCNPVEPVVTEDTQEMPVQTPTLTPKPTATKKVTETRPTSTPVPVSHIGMDGEDMRGVILFFWHSWFGEAGDTIETLVEEFNLNNKWGITIVPVYQAGLDELDANLQQAF